MPFEPSRSNGSRKNRICTAARLAVKTVGPTPFSLLNTHLDHKMDGARQLRASLALQLAHFETLYAQGASVVVIGDFNSPPAGRHAAAYEIAMGTRARGPRTLERNVRVPVCRAGACAGACRLVDMRVKTLRPRVVGKFATSFRFDDRATPRWSDFMFSGSNGDWCMLDDDLYKKDSLASWDGKSTLYEVGTCLTNDGVLASDRLFAEVILEDN